MHLQQPNINLERLIKMKILLVNNHFSNSGGAELYMLNLGNLLKKNGHEVFYFATDRRPYFEEDYKYAEYFPEYVEYQDLSKLQLIKKAFTPFYNTEAERKMKLMLEEVKPDIVHINCIFFKLTPSILKPCYKRNIPVVITTHGPQLICPSVKMMYKSEVFCKDKLCIHGNPIHCITNRCCGGSLIKSTGLAAEFTFRKIHGLYNKISHYISPSQALADLTIESGINKNKVTCINNFVKDELFEIVPTYGKGDYFLFAGRLSKEKGVRELLEAMKLLPQEINLKIAGVGPEENALKELKKELDLSNVEFLGFITGEELCNLYKNCIATIIPCNWFENFPTSVIESFAYAKPVVGTRIGGIPEMVEDYKTGLTFELKNIEDMAAKIKEIYFNDQLTLEMGRNARKKAESRYRANHYYEKLIEIYNTVV